MARVLAQREWDTDKPTLSWAMACSDAALKLYWEDGRDKSHIIKQARELFRGALSRGADQRIIFLVWYGMELGHGDTAAARACFEEWRSRGCGWGCCCVGYAEFWCHYAWFEQEYGTRARGGAVAEAALAACPRDPEVFAMYACLELRMGCDRRARRVVGRARDVFAAVEDEDAVKWITNDVERYGNYLRDAAARPTIGDLFSCLFSCVRGGSA